MSLVSSKSESRINPKRPVHWNTPQVKTSRLNKLKLENLNDSKLPVYTKPRKLHNCVDVHTPTVSKKKNLVLKRKSISMLELTSSNPKDKAVTPKKWQSKEQGDESIKKITEHPNQISFLGNNHEIELANKVCKIFIMHAWRQRRSEVSNLRNKLSRIGNEVDNLNIQVVVLRNLLESEKLRVAVSLSDAAHLKNRLENELQETGRLKQTIQVLENEKKSWKTQETNMDSEMKSLKNELRLSTEQKYVLEKEINGFSMALSSSKADKDALQQKLEQANMVIKAKEDSIQEFGQKFESLLSRISEITKKNHYLLKENERKEKKISECLNRLEKMDVELNNSQNNCKVQSEEMLQLKKDIITAEERLKLQTEKIERLNNTLQEYQNRREEFQRNLKKTRNRMIFEAIKISARLLFPIQ